MCKDKDAPSKKYKIFKILKKKKTCSLANTFARP